MADSEWLASVVRSWAETLKESGFTQDEALAAQHYIDMEYPEAFEYPKHYMALRAFFLTAQMTPGEDKDDHMFSSAAARVIIAIEAAYRMGWDDAQKKTEAKPDAPSET